MWQNMKEPNMQRLILKSLMPMSHICLYPLTTSIKQYPQPHQKSMEAPVGLHYLQQLKKTNPSTQPQLCTQSHTYSLRSYVIWHITSPAFPSYPKYLAHLHIHSSQKKKKKKLSTQCCLYQSMWGGRQSGSPVKCWCFSERCMAATLLHNNYLESKGHLFIYHRI